MLTFTANTVAFVIVVSWLAVQRKSSRGIWAKPGSILALALMTGLERTLTNASLYTITASLKTMLHAFNVPFTVVASAALGADQSSRSCLLAMECSKTDQLSLTLALTLITVGALLSAFDGTEIQGSSVGIILQLLSGVAYALRHSIAKLLYPGADSDSTEAACKPSKLEVSAVAFPVTAIVALCCIP